ncbi:hypothetical protein TRFO_05894 [Tritrichomonas foetus]|uniref:Protein kinase domain-containing protein n=1 Tax=Tritrichomonas foetus TaxID=1144522 RepID=A0A1J4K8H0_9EUKA|nr:hypothetical protein TRFO_05894 [Tritrichomonas foetus]|eukprot:OHT05725.1 hypothetical protein TRFO_05894 [Tritrichomonas foetus]
MSSGSLPWIPGNDDEISEQIMKGNLSYPNDLNSAVFRIVNKCCQVDRNDRPTIDELINDPWFENERAKLAAQTSSLMNSPNILMSQPRVSSSMNPSFSGAGNKSVLGSGVLGKGLSTSVGLFPSTSANMTGYLPKRNFCGITGTVNLPASGSLRSVFNSYNKKKLIIVRPVESQEVVRVNGSQSLAKFTLTRAPMKTHKENIITSGLQ